MTLSRSFKRAWGRYCQTSWHGDRAPFRIFLQPCPCTKMRSSNGLIRWSKKAKSPSRGRARQSTIRPNREKRFRKPRDERLNNNVFLAPCLWPVLLNSFLRKNRFALGQSRKVTTKRIIAPRVAPCHRGAYIATVALFPNHLRNTQAIKKGRHSNRLQVQSSQILGNEVYSAPRRSDEKLATAEAGLFATPSDIWRSFNERIKRMWNLLFQARLW